MDYHKVIVSNQKEETISIQKVNQQIIIRTSLIQWGKTEQAIPLVVRQKRCKIDLKEC